MFDHANSYIDSNCNSGCEEDWDYICYPGDTKTRNVTTCNQIQEPNQGVLSLCGDNVFVKTAQMSIDDPDTCIIRVDTTVTEDVNTYEMPLSPTSLNAIIKYYSSCNSQGWGLDDYSTMGDPSNYCGVCENCTSDYYPCGFESYSPQGGTSVQACQRHAEAHYETYYNSFLTGQKKLIYENKTTLGGCNRRYFPCWYTVSLAKNKDGLILTHDLNTLDDPRLVLQLITPQGSIYDLTDEFISLLEAVTGEPFDITKLVGFVIGS